MNRIMNKRNLLLTGLCSVVLLTGCGTPATDEASLDTVAKCVVANMSTEQVGDAGFVLTTRQDFQVFPDSALSGCQDEWKWKFNGQLAIQNLMPKVGGMLHEQEAFRFGMYAGMAGAQSPKAQRKAFGEIGIALEKGFAAKAGGLSCGYVEENAMALMTRLDYPFAVASLGYYGGVGDVAMAEKLAKDFVETAKKNAGYQLANYTCDVFSKQDFTKYAESQLSFYQGKHAWAPGCGLVQTGGIGDLTLKCGLKPKP